MQSSPGVLQHFFDRWTEPIVLAQVVAVVGAVVVALLASQQVQRWHERLSRHAHAEPWRTRVIEGVVMQGALLAALVLLLVVRAALATRNLTTDVLDTALELLAALMLVRLAVYLLRLSLGDRRWIRNWEQRLTLILWLVIAFELVGWFDSIENFFDSIDLLPGKSTFSLWALLKGLVVIGGFVLVASLIARTIERRVMQLQTVAVSTRIGITKFTYFFLVGLGVLLGINAAGVDLTALTVLTPPNVAPSSETGAGESRQRRTSATTKVTRSRRFRATSTMIAECSK